MYKFLTIVWKLNVERERIKIVDVCRIRFAIQKIVFLVDDVCPRSMPPNAIHFFLFFCEAGREGGWVGGWVGGRGGRRLYSHEPSFALRLEKRSEALMSAYVSICQHMSAYVSIRQHTSVISYHLLRVEKRSEAFVIHAAALVEVDDTEAVCDALPDI